MDFPANTPEPPYFAVIFTNIRTPVETDYAKTAARMEELAAGYPGFLGLESVRDGERNGITISYWRSEADLLAWKDDQEHRIAQERGLREWYECHHTRIARVERDYVFVNGP